MPLRSGGDNSIAFIRAKQARAAQDQDNCIAFVKSPPKSTSRQKRLDSGEPAQDDDEEDEVLPAQSSSPRSVALRRKAEQFWEAHPEVLRRVHLPLAAVDWEDRECELWLGSEGAFNPRATRGPSGKQGGKKLPRGSVSVIASVSECFQDYHELLWACFEAQTIEHKELVVVETYEQAPSQFFVDRQWKDRRLVYVGFQRPKGSSLSEALKLNIAVQLTGGEYVAPFGEGDFYAATYLDLLVSGLQKGARGAGPILAALSSWHTLQVMRGCFGRRAPLEFGELKDLGESDERVRDRIFSNGFAYMLRRWAAQEIPFRHSEAGEECLDFYWRLVAKEGVSSAALLGDSKGVFMHSEYDEDAPPSPEERKLSGEQAMSLYVSSSPGFESYLSMCGILDDYQAPPRKQTAASGFKPPSRGARPPYVAMMNEGGQLPSEILASKGGQLASEKLASRALAGGDAGGIDFCDNRAPVLPRSIQRQEINIQASRAAGHGSAVPQEAD